MKTITVLGMLAKLRNDGASYREDHGDPLRHVKPRFRDAYAKMLAKRAAEKNASSHEGESK